jgi:predicted lipoprotein with Yx(FWY)xxD motif
MIRTTDKPTKLRRLALAAGAVLALAACGGGSDAADDPEATAVENAESATSNGAPVATGATSEGNVITDAAGLSLYGFTPDAGGTPTCTDGCAQAWPPFTVDGDSLPDGLDASVFSVVTHPDGSTQLAAGGWPLYYFAGDAAAGEINGQGSGGNWFLAAPDGSLVGAP